MRRAFTLIEMLIATAVFVVGFTAAYGLFLAGGRLRQEADATTRIALVQSQLASELRLRIGTENADPFHYQPNAYLGDGFADNNSNNSPEEGFTPWAEDPRIWYRVVEASDILGKYDAVQLSLRLRVLFIDLGSDLGISSNPGSADAPHREKPWEWLDRRFNLQRNFATIYKPGFDQATLDRIDAAGKEGSEAWVYQVLIERHLLHEETWIIRRRARPGA